MPIRGYEIFDVRQRYIQDKYFHQIVKIKHFNLGQGQANSFYPPKMSVIPQVYTIIFKMRLLP